MSKFWDNLLRYPRFFISSLIGLILVIITPLKNLAKTQKFKYSTPAVIIFILLCIIIIGNILIAMTM